jgi:hypothetical protein
MKQVETLLLDIRVLDDGALRACRKNRKPLTDEDRAEARQIADRLPGITVDDVLRVWPVAGEAMSEALTAISLEKG